MDEREYAEFLENELRESGATDLQVKLCGRLLHNIIHPKGMQKVGSSYELEDLDVIRGLITSERKKLSSTPDDGDKRCMSGVLNRLYRKLSAAHRFKLRQQARCAVDEIKLEENAYVAQGAFSTAAASDGVATLSTSGIAPCVGVAMYDSQLKQGSLAHFDSRVTDECVDAVKHEEQLRIRRALIFMAQQTSAAASGGVPLQIRIVCTNSPMGHFLQSVVKQEVERLVVAAEGCVVVLDGIDQERPTEDVYLNLDDGRIGRYEEKREPSSIAAHAEVQQCCFYSKYTGGAASSSAAMFAREAGDVAKAAQAKREVDALSRPTVLVF